MRWRQGWKKIQERSRKKLCNSAIAEQRQPFPVVYNKTVRKKTKKEVRVLGQKDILMECALYIRSHAKERAKMTLEVFGPMAAECGKVKCRMEFDDLAERYLKE